jgi:protein-S-isoprenylcysteine O-methyltransferase Ste14
VSLRSRSVRRPGGASAAAHRLLGVQGISGAQGSPEWLGGALFASSIGVSVTAPVLGLADALDPIAALDGTLAHGLGIAMFAVGFAATVGAQLAMGSSWRIGVERSERTELVTGGPFAVVRNPIYSAMIPAVAGLALLVPNVVALAGVALLVVALEIQVRVVEEPYLLRTHGDAYAGYAGRVGRFVPGMGRLPAPRA